MIKRKRLGRGLEDISHYFISPSTKKDQKDEDLSSLSAEGESQGHVISIVDLFDPQRGAFLVSRIGAELSKNGFRTLLVDADIRFPSIAFTLGLSIPGYSFRHYSQEKYKPSDLICTGPSGIKLLAPRLSLKNLSKLKILDLSPMLEALSHIESEIDLIILREYESELQPLMGNALFVIPASHTGMIRAYREIKSFVAGGEGKRIGIIITDVEEKINAVKAYERICGCIETYCEITPYFSGYLSDVTAFPVSSIVSHISEMEHEKKKDRKGRGLFFERLRYLTGIDRLTGDELSKLLV